MLGNTDKSQLMASLKVRSITFAYLDIGDNPFSSEEVSRSILNFVTNGSGLNKSLTGGESLWYILPTRPLLTFISVSDINGIIIEFRLYHHDPDDRHYHYGQVFCHHLRIILSRRRRFVFDPYFPRRFDLHVSFIDDRNDGLILADRIAKHSIESEFPGYVVRCWRSMPFTLTM